MGPFKSATGGISFSGKTTLFLLALLGGASVSEGRIGESLPECEKRYGVTSKIRYIGEPAYYEENANPNTAPVNIRPSLLIEPIADLVKDGELSKEDGEKMLVVAYSHSYWHSLRRAQVAILICGSTMEKLREIAGDFIWNGFLTGLAKADTLEGEAGEFEFMERCFSLAGSLQVESSMREKNWLEISEGLKFAGFRSWAERDVVVCLFDSGKCEYFSYYEAALPIEKVEKLISTNFPQVTLHDCYLGKANCHGAIVHFWNLGNGYHVIFNEGQALTLPVVAIFSDVRPRSENNSKTMTAGMMRKIHEYFSDVLDVSRSKLDQKRKERDESLFK